MLMIKSFIWVTTIVSLGLGMVWQKNDLLNLLVKLGHYGLAIWGFYILFKVL